jgi:lipopolysaccharide/colanic/teichoic acid biosynthesis glycosyltransferase
VNEETIPTISNSRVRSTDAILSARQLQEAVLQERDRADRTGAEFSLVLYTVCQAEPPGQLPPEFLRALRRRIRLIDQVGWLQDGIVGLLLPSTGFQGASALASAFASSPAGRKTCTAYEVFTYPSRWYRGGSDGRKADNGNGHGDGRKDLLVRKVEELLARRVPGWKRAADRLGAALALLLASPLFLAICLYIKLVSPGPVLFRQTRIGYKGRPFTFLKFRTMHPDNDASSHRDHLKSLIRSDAPMLKLDSTDDPRIIPGARILRRACLDELPQLFNVLKGEMSLVGPRPCLPYEVEEYRRWHTHRFDVLPGLTGLWQVSGKNRLSFQQMIRLDIAYALSLNLLQDLKILLLTGPAIAGFVLEALGRRLARGRA